MRRVALLGLILCLSGCGYKTWSDPPFTTGTNPNLPDTDSENVQRVLGHQVNATPIAPEAGNIWPGPLPPSPTLGDLERESGGAQPQLPTLGSPLSRGEFPPSLPQTPSQGSSTPPPGGSAVPPAATTAPPLSSYAAPAAKPPAAVPGGKVLQTPGGPSVTTGGGPGYNTAIQPGGGQSIVVPNGNGTSTVIHADGRIETIPTPK
ncbi:MAG TPA: hypothetical protein VHB27_24675 [Rhodopila sp.]|uniref:hypothetical protein n=1 Tax=Rhodopila sp. TaxID=2480087 RepID=UPI002CC0490D|nr:hypothetical protein [Rhodopila sp.]HVY18438.1 hypothetical protein [Rhodopila sp.]